MTAWIQITIEDLEDYLLAAQIAAIRTAALSDGQDDPVEQAIIDVTQEIRTYVANCDGNDLSANTAAIPPVLKRHACYLVLEAAQMRIPALELTDNQVRMANNARSLLTKVSECKFDVETPDDPVSSSGEVQSQGGATIVKSRNPKATPEAMDQL